MTQRSSSKPGTSSAGAGRERLSRLVDQLPIAIWSTDRNLVIDYCAGPLYGRDNLPSAETLIGKPIQDAVQTGTGAVEAHRRALAGLASDYEVVFNGHTLEARVRPLRDRDGSIRGVLGSAMDITDRRRAQTELRAAKEQLVLVADSIPSLISYINRDGYYVYVNKAYEQWFGKSRDDVEGRHYREVLGEAVYHKIRPKVDLALTGQRVSYEADLPYRERGLRSVNATYVPHVSASGQVAGIVVLVNDISELRRKQDAQAFLADAGAVLSSSLDPRETLETVARLAVPRIADWCAIDLLSPEGLIERVRVVHENPAMLARAAELVLARPVSLSDTHGIGAVLRSGEPELVPWIPDAIAHHPGANPEDERIARDLGLRSDLIVPLVGRDRILGAITFLTAESGRRYDADDLDLARELARRTVLALENATLYRKVRELNHTLALLVEERTRELVESRGRYEVLSHNSPVGIFRTNAEGDCLEVNRRWTEITGMEPARAMGSGWEDALHPADRDRVAREWFEAASSGRPFISEYRFVRPDGTVTWVLGQASELHDADGARTGYIGTVTDINDRKTKEEALMKAGAELSSANRELESFAYTIAHDLRAPLRSMVGLSQILTEDYRGKPFDQEGQTIVERILATGQRMDQLTQDLLSYARVSRAEVDISSLDPGSVVDEVLVEMSPDIAAMKADVARSDLPGPVDGNRTMLKQVLSNLIYNACKFVAPGKTARVRIRGEDRGSVVRVTVEDNGIGILPEHRERLFRLFERLHTRDAYPGTGLGLALVKRAAERIGASVGFDSDPGRGSRFWIDLRKSA